MTKILKYYPFPLYPERPVQVIEGFAAYDGNLGDAAGEPHKGIDFVRKNEFGGFQSFPVHAAHEGDATCGFEESLGYFVIIRKKVVDRQYFNTVYAHLDEMPNLPQYLRSRNKFEWPSYSDFISHSRQVAAGTALGLVGTSGWTNGFPQLHFELHDLVGIYSPKRKKIDPYGVNDRFSSGRYPQPGSSLAGLQHFWTTEFPKFPLSPYSST